MTPHYVFWKCTYCEEDYLRNDCYGGGKYCAVEPSNKNQKGREIILEDLRQKCIYNQYYESPSTRYAWWAYMSLVHKNCYSVINEDCSKKAHATLFMDWEKTQQCVKDSFTNSDWSSRDTNNTIID